jgi:hypothetical protein
VTDTRRFVVWLWLLSGLPIGLILVFAPAPIGFAFFAAAIVLETGHVLSPIVLVWTHAELRRRALREWEKWIAVPCVLIASSLVVPMPCVFAVYWPWNVYHFGMQHFGVVSMWQGERSFDTRVRTGLICLGLTTIGMGVLPFCLHDPRLSLLMAGVLSFNHWITDLGLSSRVSRHHWLFLAGMLALGCVGFVWLIPRVDHVATWFVPPIISARWGVGMVHFLYSGWIWRLPETREALA